MKKYSGQAIAIIMVVLVVAAIIGASLYSRMVRNKGEVVDTRESQMALEQAGNVLDTFLTSDIPNLQKYLSAELAIATDNTITLEGTDIIQAFFDDADPPLGALELDLLNFGSGSCSEPTVTITFAGPSDGIEYGVGQVMAINLGEIGSVPAGCQANLYFETAGMGDHLFTVKHVYRNSANQEVTPYALDHMKLYCLNTSGAACNSASVAPVDSVEQSLASGGSLAIDLTTANLYEVRVLPLKEKVKVSVVGTAQCGNILDNYLIRSTAACTGQERSMEVVVPSATNVGYPAIFDYTIYNSNGTLTPHND